MNQCALHLKEANLTRYFSQIIRRISLFTCLNVFSIEWVFQPITLFDKLKCWACVSMKAGSDHNAGSVGRRPQVVDGGHGWERTGRLPRLPACSYVTEREKKRERETEFEVTTCCLELWWIVWSHGSKVSITNGSRLNTWPANSSLKPRVESKAWENTFPPLWPHLQWITDSVYSNWDVTETVHSCCWPQTDAAFFPHIFRFMNFAQP